jgi:hypothetical protein
LDWSRLKQVQVMTRARQVVWLDDGRWLKDWGPGRTGWNDKQ